MAIKGTKWKIIKDFDGMPSHSQGGVDITISNNGVSMRIGGQDIKAANGLVIPSDGIPPKGNKDVKKEDPPKGTVSKVYTNKKGERYVVETDTKYAHDLGIHEAVRFLDDDKDPPQGTVSEVYTNKNGERYVVETGTEYAHDRGTPEAVRFLDDGEETQNSYRAKRSESEFYRLYSNAVGLKKDAKKAEYGNGWVLTYPNGSTEFISNRSKSEPPDIKDGVTKEYKENYEIMPEREGYKYKKNKNGYLYKDVSSTNPKVEYEGDKAINIAKFAFAPLFLPEDIAGHNYNKGEIDNEGYLIKEYNNHPNNRSYNLNITEAKNKSLKDLTTYFYSFDDVTKEEAKNKSIVFYNNNIKPLVESDYYKYRKMGIRLGRVDENRGKNEDWFIEISKYNKKNNANISNDDMLKGLIEYNIKFRKLSKKEATKLAKEAYNKYLVI